MSPFESFITIFMVLIFAHCLADYPLQGDFLSKAKNRFDSPYKENVPWTAAMFGHCSIQAGFVLLILGSPILAGIEFITHWITDEAKNGKKISFWQDQLVHITFKLIYVILLFTDTFPMPPILRWFS